MNDDSTNEVHKLNSGTSRPGIAALKIGVKTITNMHSSACTNNRTCTAKSNKMSHFIFMLNIQIDTKALELVTHYLFDNIKLSFFASHMKKSFPYLDR